jgi:hypothetical protein
MNYVYGEAVFWTENLELRDRAQEDDESNSVAEILVTCGFKQILLW